MTTATRQRTSTDFLALTISAGGGKEEHTGRGEEFRRNQNFRYRVQVQSDATGARIFFDYHDSIDRHGKGINQLDRENLLEAFRCFVMDAQAAESTFRDFADDFGYDRDSISAKRTFDACRASLRKFERLFHDHREPSAILELLAAEGIE